MILLSARSAAIDLADDGRCPRFGVDVAHERLELARADGPAEKLLRDIRQLMRFVDDDDVGAREQLAETALLQGQVRQQQVMVHDHDVRRLRAPSRLEHATAIEELAIATETILDRGRHDRPQRVIVGEILELGEVAGVARLAPVGKRTQGAQRLGVARAVVQRRLEPMPTQVVVAPFQ